MSQLHEEFDFALDRSTLQRLVRSNLHNLKDFKVLASKIDAQFVKSLKVRPIDKTKPLTIYTDGSFKDEYKAYTSGVVITQEGKICTLLFSKGNAPDKVTSRNIGGECSAVELLNYLNLQKGFADAPRQHIDIICDLEHVWKWSNGLYKTKKPCSIKMKQSLSQLEQYFDVDYHWVKGHSGKLFNELADILCTASYDL